ncbi:MAG: glycine--tRNA ligase subunit beta, partial [Rhodospirillaceae bacterium]|nr:glycine--tRNA ligase subunit beta [Rhodospirillaceae bacterium]
MSELLLEIISEEIPAGMQIRAIADLEANLVSGLTEIGLSYNNVETFVTPRRLTVSIGGVAEKTEGFTEERRGPKTDAPEKAVRGFLGSVGLTINEIEKRQTDKGEFLYAVIHVSGQDALDLLPPLVEQAIKKISWPKSMRWANHTVRWVRPISNILCIFNNNILPIKFGPFESCDFTISHRMLGSKKVKIRDLQDYKRVMKEDNVLIDRKERRDKIIENATTLLEQEDLRLVSDDNLLEEVLGLVEMPVVLMGSIDPEFMDVPSEVLVTTMKKNQKYFSLTTPDGCLASKFLVVSNQLGRDGGAAIVAGNERVLRARLADAKFFWEQDKKKRLESRLSQLNNISFHPKLGSLANKVDRMVEIASKISDVMGLDNENILRAVRLAKADLSSGMVIEFPNLQGIMGSYYAINDGESQLVANAIRDHYSPMGPSDSCPTEPTSVVVSLADKIDSLISFWAINEKPTGSKDPFGLRRAALGIIRLLIDNKVRLSLSDIFDHAWESGKYTNIKRDVVDDLVSFCADRLKIHMKSSGKRHDLIAAVFSVNKEDDFVKMLSCVDALTEFIESDDGSNLLVAFRRAANILRIEEKKDQIEFDDLVDTKLLDEMEEIELDKALTKIITRVTSNLEYEEFNRAMSDLSHLRSPLDNFFEKV